MTAIKATVRIALHGEPILFFHDVHENRHDMATCYTHVGQHSDAARAYYLECTKAPLSRAQRAACDELVREWNAQPGDTTITRTARSPWGY